MVKKIVALSIAFALMLTSLLYGTIDFSTETPDNLPFEYGKGEGEDLVIESVAELEKLLNNIPSLNDYLVTSSITELNPEFKPFTMVEDGTSNVTEKRNYGNSVITTETDLYHVLEVCFTNTSVYYSCVGESTVTTTYETGANSDSATLFDKAERTTTSFDVDIYYSKDLIMLRYNSYSLKTEEKTSVAGNWKTPEGNDSETAMMNAMFDAVEECFGKWMTVKEMTEEDMSNLANLTEEEMMIEMLVYETCSLFSSAWTDSIVQSTEGNVDYLTRLSTFINTSLSTAFDKIGSDYALKSEAKGPYISAITGVTLTPDALEDARAVSSFGLDSDVIVITQNVDLDYMGKEFALAAETTFKNIGNTVVNLKGESVPAVYDVLGASLRKVFTDLMNQEGGAE